MVGTKRWVWGFVLMVACAGMVACGGGGPSDDVGPGVPQGRHRFIDGERMVKWRGRVWVGESFLRQRNDARQAIVKDLMREAANTLNAYDFLDENAIVWAAVYNVEPQAVMNRPVLSYRGVLALKFPHGRVVEVPVYRWCDPSGNINFD